MDPNDQPLYFSGLQACQSRFLRPGNPQKSDPRVVQPRVQTLKPTPHVFSDNQSRNIVVPPQTSLYHESINNFKQNRIQRENCQQYVPNETQVNDTGNAGGQFVSLYDSVVKKTPQPMLQPTPRLNIDNGTYSPSTAVSEISIRQQAQHDMMSFGKRDRLIFPTNARANTEVDAWYQGTELPCRMADNVQRCRSPSDSSAHGINYKTRRPSPGGPPAGDTGRGTHCSPPPCRGRSPLVSSSRHSPASSPSAPASRRDYRGDDNNRDWRTGDWNRRDDTRRSAQDRDRASRSPIGHRRPEADRTSRADSREREGARERRERQRDSDWENERRREKGHARQRERERDRASVFSYRDQEKAKDSNRDKTTSRERDRTKEKSHERDKETDFDRKKETISRRERENGDNRQIDKNRDYDQARDKDRERDRNNDKDHEYDRLKNKGQQGDSDNDKDRERNREENRDRNSDREKDKNHEGDRAKEKSGDRDCVRDKEESNRDRGKSKDCERRRESDRGRDDRSRDRENQRERVRDRERDRERGRGREKERDRELARERNKERDRERDRERERDKERNWERDRKQEGEREKVLQHERDKHYRSESKANERGHVNSNSHPPTDCLLASVADSSVCSTTCGMIRSEGNGGTVINVSPHGASMDASVSEHQLVPNMTQCLADGPMFGTSCPPYPASAPYAPLLRNPPPPASQTKPSHVRVSVSSLVDEPFRSVRPTNIVVLMRGLPGSGKSTVARLLKVSPNPFGPEAQDGMNWVCLVVGIATGLVLWAYAVLFLL